MIRLRRFPKRAATAALFFFLALPDPAAAQGEKPVAKPDVKVGDRWVYRRTDRRVKPPTFVYEARVTFVDSRAIHTVLERQGIRKESDATFTPEWNSIVSIDEGVIELEKGMLQFPLVVGRSYEAAWEIRRPRVGSFHVRHERKVKVIGWEDIEVPAGKFRALKIQADGHFRRLDRPVADEARNTIWYSPQVRRWVKSRYQDVQGETGEELMYYRLQ